MRLLITGLFLVSSFLFASEYQIDRYNFKLINQKEILITDSVLKKSLEIKDIGFLDQHYKFVELVGTYKIEAKDIFRSCHVSSLELIDKAEDSLNLKVYFHGFECAPYGNIKFFINKRKNLEFDYQLNHVFAGQPKIFMNFQKHEREFLWGSGITPSFLNLNKRRIPLLSQEQGHGRGQRIVFETLQNLVAKGSTGSEVSTYSSLPLFWSDQLHGIVFNTNEYGTFNFKKNLKKATFFRDQLSGEILFSESPKKMIESITEILGRPRKTPDWAHRGVLVGLMGGEEKVYSVHRKLKEKNIPVAGYWLQDWVGQNQTFTGTRLKWNWKVDRDLYPHWEKMVSDFEREDVAILGYINPYLYGSENELLDHARENNFLVKDEKKDLFTVPMGGFEAFLVDLFNPEAYQWTKNNIRNLFKKYKMKGWMADFSEAYPFERNFKGYHSFERHHQYIELWSKANREAIDEIKMSQNQDLFFFNRSVHKNSLANIQSLWTGDHMTSWDRLDGLKSSLLSKISAGMSGISVIHSDTGGYVSYRIPLLFKLKRSRSLLKSWIELNTFSSLLRTHEGIRPDLASQVFDDDVIEHYALWSQVFSELFEYRKDLLQEAYERGIPLMRHMFLEFPQDEQCKSLSSQFMFGERYLVAPKLNQKKNIKFYLPKGSWRQFKGDLRIDSVGQFFKFKSSSALIFERI